MARILVVEDELGPRFVMSEMLVRSGHEAKAASKPENAIALGPEYKPDVLVTDWMLKTELTGLDVARTLKQQLPELRIVFISGHPLEELRPQAKDLQPVRFVRKPCEFFELLNAIHEML